MIGSVHVPTDQLVTESRLRVTELTLQLADRPTIRPSPDCILLVPGQLEHVDRLKDLHPNEVF